MRKIKVVVNVKKETFNPGYISSSTKLIELCKEQAKNRRVIKTNNYFVMEAYMALHRQGVFNVSIELHGKKYDLDVKGQMIQPWPDEFQELGFNLIFHH